jgi:Ca-activated chloride channel family protein
MNAKTLFDQLSAKAQRSCRLFFGLLTVLSILLSGCASATQSVTLAEEPMEAGQNHQEAIAPQVEQPAADELETAPQPLAQEPKPLATALPVVEPKLPAPTPAGVTFEHSGVNPFVDTYEDHLSTFALDVDTASYTVMRSYVQSGSLPPAESVRVEEYVNYFNQDYPNPPDVAFGIYADGAPSPFYRDGSYILRFGIQGYQVAEWDRKPVSLTFVIDTSGSMGMGNRLELLKRSLEMLVERLRPEDSVSIVEYGSNARLVLSPTSGRDAGAILDAVYSLSSGGSTNAYDGIKMGYEMAIRAYKAGGTNRVILCSDGVANVGATDPQVILDEVRGYVEEGIYLTSIGVGMGNFNDVFMEQLADNGNGNYAYIDDLDEARRLFVDDLTANLEVIALDAKVQVDFNPDVVAYYRLIGYENRDVADEDFRNDSVDAGEVGAGHSVTALYAVVLKPQSQGRIATVQMRWADPETRAVKEINGNFNTWDLAASFDQASPRYQMTVVVAEFAEVLRHSPWAAETNLSRLHSMAYELAAYFPGDAQVTEFVDLLGQASGMVR